MEFEEQEEELCMGGGGAPGYDPIGNPTRVKMPEPMMVAQPMRSSSNNNNNNSSSNNNMNMIVKARYRECLKNHAVGIGGHALDGCGEFMAAGTEGTLDALKCAACNCHRNFHRKETESTGEPYLLTHHPYPHHPHLQQHHHQPPPFSAYYRSPAGYLHVGGQQRGPLALPSTSGAGAGGGRDTEQEVSNPSGGDGGGGSSSRKRFRTKFTQEQKDKMLELAERVGWRIQKQDESLVQEFCNESGVKRQVLKVWMHNNKHTLGKKP